MDDTKLKRAGLDYWPYPLVLEFILLMAKNYAIELSWIIVSSLNRFFSLYSLLIGALTMSQHIICNWPVLVIWNCRLMFLNLTPRFQVQIIKLCDCVNNFLISFQFQFLLSCSL